MDKAVISKEVPLTLTWPDSCLGSRLLSARLHNRELTQHELIMEQLIDDFGIDTSVWHLVARQLDVDIVSRRIRDVVEIRPAVRLFPVEETHRLVCL